MPEARQDRIVNICNSQRFVTVRELTALTGASTPTIQRDLQELDDAGMLRRVRGGAATLASVVRPVSWSDRVGQNQDDKLLIGAAAARHLKGNISVFLGSGTTVLCMLQTLVPETARQIHFVTNAYPVACRLSELGLSHLVLPGRLLPQVECVVGEHAMVMLEDFHFDLCVLGFQGLDIKRGLTDADAAEALLKAQVSRRSVQVLGLADSSKYEHIAAARIGPLSLLHTLVTHELDESAISRIETAGVKVELAS